MNLSWKLFFITTPIFVLFLTVFGTWIIQDNFQSGLNQEIERCMAENHTFQNSYELTRNSLSNEQWEQMTLKKAVESFHKRREEKNGNVRIYDRACDNDRHQHESDHNRQPVFFQKSGKPF